GYTAPHWPLHATEEDIQKYLGRFDAGWDELRRQRLARLVARGINTDTSPATDRGARGPPGHDMQAQDWEALRMAVRAAIVIPMDQGIGRILDELDHQGISQDTIVIFLSDNGGCAEEMPAESAREFVTTYVTFDAQTRDGRPVRAGNSPL